MIVALLPMEAPLHTNGRSSGQSSSAFGLPSGLTALGNLSLMNTLWHNRQIKRRGTLPFDSENAISLYADRDWPMPTGETLSI